MLLFWGHLHSCCVGQVLLGLIFSDISITRIYMYVLYIIILSIYVIKCEFSDSSSHRINFKLIYYILNNQKVVQSKHFLLICLFYIPTAVCCSSSPPSPSLHLFSKSLPSTSLFIFRKGQALNGYQHNRVFQLAIRLSTWLCV